MLDRAKHLYRTSVMAVDGAVGRVDEVLYDDSSWAIRYLVVDTGHRLPGRKVLVPPRAFEPMTEGGPIVVRWTRQFIQDSPSVDFEDGAPLSRERECALNMHYDLVCSRATASQADSGIPAGALDGPPANPQRMMPPAASAGWPMPQGALRRASAFNGYAIHATDGPVGRVTDILFDNDAWVIRHVVVGTRRGWLRGASVLIGVHWIERVDWARQAVDVSITTAQVRSSPAYDGRSPVHRDYEVRLHSAYDRTGYRD